jgi:RHS repeat-associated protein
MQAGGLVTPINEYHYLHRDYLGSILAITNSSGALKEQRQFGAWGKADKFVDSAGNTTFTHGSLIGRGYTGHEHFFEVDLIHMNGRMYDANLGRFLSPDNYIQDPFNTQNYNRYGYVLNSPLSYVDPSGEWFIAALIVAAFTYVKAAHDNKGADGSWQWNPTKWTDVPVIGISANGSFDGSGGLNLSAVPTLTPTGANTALPVGTISPEGGWNIDLGVGRQQLGDGEEKKYDGTDLVRETIIGGTGAALVDWGSATVPKPGGVGGGGKSGPWTSRASKTLRATRWGAKKIPFRVLGAKTLGAVAGRFVPILGWGLLAYDVIDFSINFPWQEAFQILDKNQRSLDSIYGPGVIRITPYGPKF